ncbi:MAG: NADP-dependent oxidoreductase [Sporocytophaga sp.]|uniref:NADP-dependent oxidoreductase n=1 Tax=Sporocytophaga sp. TaxID=2231183 RepID=UPI001B1C6833|nr:NADP-dependent oxidoreductase [Sporocytophaga sp.]MBO9701746.1 NADP-dependent oxidoreductase [Sporocytophaga sp.]
MKTTQQSEGIGTKSKVSGDKMKAVVIHNYGDISVLSTEEVPIPKIGQDEILVKVQAAGINPIDWKVREGYKEDFLDNNNPGILGWDVAGTVTEVGDLVTRFRPGDKIYANPTTARNGAYAEYIAIRSYEAALVPKSISMIEAAGVPLAAMTAWMGLFEKANLKADQKVLIHGASGGVGTFAVQLAKIAGAHVIGTCSKANIEMVKSIGADQVIDYRSEDFSTKLKNIDVVLDTIGGDTQVKSLQVLKSGGVLVSTVGVNAAEKSPRSDVKTIAYYSIANGAKLAEIGGLIEKGLIKIIIDRTFSLENVKEAHQLSQTHHAKGKIILTVDQKTKG